MINFYTSPITDNVTKPVHPITDMVKTIQAYRSTTDEERMDYILQSFMSEHLEDLKHGPVEFTSGTVFVFPDGDTYEFDTQGKAKLILHAEKYGVELTYKLKAYQFITDEVVWVLDVKEEK